MTALLQHGERAMSDLIRIGVLTKPHGLKGYVCLHLDNPIKSLQQFSYKSIIIEKNSEQWECDIEHTMISSKKLVVKLVGLDSRTDIEVYRGCEVYVWEDQIPAPKEGEFYYYQIVGFQVSHKDGGPLGEVTGVMSGGVQDLLVISYQEKEVLLPAIKPFLVDVNLEAKEVIVDPIEGFFE